MMKKYRFLCEDDTREKANPNLIPNSISLQHTLHFTDNNNIMGKKKSQKQRMAAAGKREDASLTETEKSVVSWL
ncbi:hypothetical protein JZU54_00085, partial [bacterium]|nr:hypothetical protein [bacterium]